MPEGEVRRDSAIPLYFQLQELLKEQIEAGSWSAGEMIPSEPELCDTYGVSRTVVRQALSVLEQDGQLRRVRGRGTFVSAPKIEQRVGGLSRLLTHMGPEHEVLALDHRTERASRRVSGQLKLPQGAQILRVMSLLRIEGAPVALFDSFFPVDVAFPLTEQLTDVVPSPLTSTARIRAVELARTTLAIETSFCSSWEAERLAIPLKGAVFVTLCTEFQKSDGEEPRPLEVARGVYRVDRVQLRFDVASNGDVPAALWHIAEA